MRDHLGRTKGATILVAFQKMTHLTAHLLGGIAFTVDDKPITQLPTRVGQAVLIYVLHQPRPVSRDKLIDWFFQGSDPKQARINLRATLSRIKKQIGDVLDANRAEVWVSADVEMDAAQFSEQLGSEQSTAQAMIPTLALYEGDFLAGFYLRDAPEFEQWMVVERERLRLLAIGGLQKLVRWQMEDGAFGAALQSAEKLLKIEPLLEQTQRDKMLLLTRTGQRALALRHYETVETLFDEELGVPLAPETTALYERIQHTPFPPPLVLPTVRRAFVGRSAEITLLQKTVANPDRRLITLQGTGGVGKTRLSHEVAQRIHQTTPGLFLDGIYFVELVAVDSAEAAAVQIAQTLDLSLRGQQPATIQLTQFLQPKELLLILDNFEQLVECATAFIAQLIDTAPDLKLIITSRERLNLYAESVLEVGGLDEAVAFFVANAKQHALGFVPSAENIQQMTTICDLLEGVPLGIELAAGWLRHQSLDKIAVQITESLSFLKTSLRDVPDRQRSLRAVFLHSWALLTDALRQSLAALAIFPAGFSADAAIQIAQTDQGQLAALIDKSLLQQTEADRFALHPLIREFAHEQLAENKPRLASLRATHSAYFLDFLHQLEPKLRGELQIEARTTITLELDNVRRAWRDSADVTAIDRAIVSTFRYYDHQNYFTEAHDLFASAIQQLDDVSSKHGLSLDTPSIATTYGTLLSRQAWFTFRLDKLKEAISVMQSAVPFLEQGNNEIRLAQALCDLATFCRYTGDIPQLEKAHTQAYSLYEKHDDVHGMLVIRTVQTYIARDAGRLDDARDKALAALGLADPVINWQATNNLLKVLGSIAFHQGNSADARAYGHQALAHALENNHRMSEVESHYLIAQAELGLGNLAAAEAQISTCYEKLQPISVPLKMASLQLLWFEIAHQQGDHAKGRACLVETATQLAGLSAKPMRLRWLAGCAKLARESGLESAERWIQAIFSDPHAPAPLKNDLPAVTKSTPNLSTDDALREARAWLSRSNQ